MDAETSRCYSCEKESRQTSKINVYVHENFLNNYNKKTIELCYNCLSEQGQDLLEKYEFIWGHERLKAVKKRGNLKRRQKIDPRTIFSEDLVGKIEKNL